MSDAASAVETPDEIDVPVSEVPINLTTVYELVDSAEDRLSAQITDHFAELDGKITILLAQNNWLGQEMIPAVDGLHSKIDGIMADVKGFIAVASKIRLPGMPKLSKGGIPDGSGE